MTLFSFGDKLPERYFILHNFPAFQKSILLVMLQSKDIKAGEGREKKSFVEV